MLTIRFGAPHMHFMSEVCLRDFLQAQVSRALLAVHHRVCLRFFGLRLLVVHGRSKKAREKESAIYYFGYIGTFLHIPGCQPVRKDTVQGFGFRDSGFEWNICLTHGGKKCPSVKGVHRKHTTLSPQTKNGLRFRIQGVGLRVESYRDHLYDSRYTR